MDIDWSNMDEVLNYMRNGGEELYRIDESLLSDMDFLRIAAKIDKYIVEIAVNYLTDEQEQELRDIVQKEESRKADIEVSKKVAAEKKENFLLDMERNLVRGDGEYIMPTRFFSNDYLTDLDVVQELILCFPIDGMKYFPETFYEDIPTRLGEFREKRLFDLLIETGGDQIYIEFLKKVERIHGRDVIIENMESIKAIVPFYALKEFYGMDLDKPETLDLEKILKEFPRGVAFEIFGLEKLIESAEKSENINLEDLYYEGGITIDDLVEYYNGQLPQWVYDDGFYEQDRIEEAIDAYNEYNKSHDPNKGESPLTAASVAVAVLDETKNPSGTDAAAKKLEDDAKAIEDPEKPENGKKSGDGEQGDND